MTILHSSIACRATKATDRRRHLVDVARKLFTQHGFHSTGVAQIAAASGIRVGQIYRDFSAKEDIVAAIVAVDLADFLDEAGLRSAVATRDGAAVREWIGRFVRVDDPIEECRLMTEIAAEAARNERIAAIQRETDAKINDLLTTALEVLAPGDARAAERDGAVSLILVLGMGLMYRRLVDPAGQAALARRIGALLERELAALLPAA